MFLDVSRLGAGVDIVTRQFEPSAFEAGDEEFVITAPVAFTAEVRKDEKKVRLVGRVQTTLSTGCSRCLEPFAIPVDAAFDALLLPASADAAEAEREIAAEDLGVSFYSGDTIDLGAIMREQFYLALPMKALCRHDCLGLCPVCGVNRNHETCTCQPAWVDPRLEGLRRFIQE
jgi:uncharacterized protein